MSNSTRFDPYPDMDYGECVTCGVSLKTEEDSKSHMKLTYEGAKKLGDGGMSHQVRTLNPTRKQRLIRMADQIVEDAIQETMEALDSLVDDGSATETEITDALRWNSDFQEAWKEYIAEENR